MVITLSVWLRPFGTTRSKKVIDENTIFFDNTKMGILQRNTNTDVTLTVGNFQSDFLFRGFLGDDIFQNGDC